MKWRIKHKDTGLFLEDFGKWTHSEASAMTFSSAITLTDFLQKSGMKEQMRLLDFIPPELPSPSAMPK